MHQILIHKQYVLERFCFGLDLHIGNVKKKEEKYRILPDVSFKKAHVMWNMDL